MSLARRGSRATSKEAVEQHAELIVVSKGERRRPDRQTLFVLRPNLYEQSLPGPGTHRERAIIPSRSTFDKHLDHELT